MILKPTTKNIIDLHCDTLSKIHKRGGGLSGCGDLQFSPEKLPAGYALCQLMAAYVPDSLRGDKAEAHFLQLAGLFRTEVTQALKGTPITAALTVEGGAALNGKLANVERFAEMGVRLITLTWNAENELGGGAGTDIGLKPFGCEAVAEMERLGVTVDTSHLSERAFWDLCGIARKPFIASHSNARAICGHRRNLTDEMFREIMRRGGLVGINFHKNFIREDAENGRPEDLLRHVHHFLGLGGGDTLALGSDFDGCDTPDYLSGGISRLPWLAEALEQSGIPAETVDKIMFQNADRYFTQLGVKIHDVSQHTQ